MNYLFSTFKIVQGEVSKVSWLFLLRSINRVITSPRHDLPEYLPLIFLYKNVLFILVLPAGVLRHTGIKPSGPNSGDISIPAIGNSCQLFWFVVALVAEIKAES